MSRIYLPEDRNVRREQLNAANRRYYRRNAPKLREAQRQRDAQNRGSKRANSERFAALHPTYWRDYQRRRRLKLAWAKWVRICATPPGERG